MLISVERTQKDFAESDQVHLSTMLAQLHTKLVGMFEKYVEEQLKFIEEARHKTKRKGVLPFMRIFPVSNIFITSFKGLPFEPPFLTSYIMFFSYYNTSDMLREWRHYWKATRTLRPAS